MKQFKNMGKKYQGGFVSWIPAAVGIGSALFGGKDSGSGQGTQAQAAANPLAPYQQEWASQLNTLMQDPSSVTNTPGYKFGMDQGQQALQRGLAGTGQTQSGQEQIALQQYGQGYAGQQYQQQLGNLSSLATGNAIAGQQAGANQQQGQQTGLAQGVGALANIYGTASKGGAGSSLLDTISGWFGGGSGGGSTGMSLATDALF